MNYVIERVHRTLKHTLRSISGNWAENIPCAVHDCNRVSGAFLEIYNRTAVPFSDWPTSSSFIQRSPSVFGPLPGDFVAVRERKPSNTLSHRFNGRFRMIQRHGNSVILADKRQINLHHCVLVGRVRLILRHCAIVSGSGRLSRVE